MGNSNSNIEIEFFFFIIFLKQRSIMGIESVKKVIDWKMFLVSILKGYLCIESRVIDFL